MLPCSCPPRGPQLFHSQVKFTSQERACQCTIDFHSQVISLSRTCLQVHPLLSLASHLAADFIPSGRLATGTDFFCGAVILLFRAWSCQQVPRILLCRTPTVGWVFLYSCRSSCSATAYWCHTSCWTVCPNRLGSTLSYPFCGASSLLNWACPCHRVPPLLKTLCMHFCHLVGPLSFLIPPLKINMSSNPVVRLPLTYAWGLLGVCHRDGIWPSPCLTVAATLYVAWGRLYLLV